jgi:hypothetical protein
VNRAQHPAILDLLLNRDFRADVDRHLDDERGARPSPSL